MTEIENMTKIVRRLRQRLWGKRPPPPAAAAQPLIFLDYLFGHGKVGMRRGRGAVRRREGVRHQHEGFVSTSAGPTYAPFTQAGSARPLASCRAWP